MRARCFSIHSSSSLDRMQFILESSGERLERHRLARVASRANNLARCRCTSTSKVLLSKLWPSPSARLARSPVR